MLVNIELVSLSVWRFLQVIIFGDQKVKYTKLNEVITIVDSSSEMDNKSEFEQYKRSKRYSYTTAFFFLSKLTVGRV